MSNCIRIHSPVVFAPGHVRADDLKRDVEAATDHGMGKPLTLEQSKSTCFWWFLKGAVSFFEDGTVTVLFGHGKSMHTWRDFEWLLRELKPYVLKETVAQVSASDEFDGFESEFKLRVDFKNGVCK